MFDARKLSTLNALESCVHNYIIKNINAVIYMTIRELADN